MGLQKYSGIYTETGIIYSPYTHITGVDNLNAIPKVYFNVKTSNIRGHVSSTSEMFRSLF